MQLTNHGFFLYIESLRMFSNLLCIPRRQCQHMYVHIFSVSHHSPASSLFLYFHCLFFLLDIVFTALILISIESSECSLSDCFYSIITSEKMTKLKEIPIAKLFVLYHPQTVLCGGSTSASRVLCHLSVNTKHCGCF